jgi:hypothetical protein
MSRYHNTTCEPIENNNLDWKGGSREYDGLERPTRGDLFRKFCVQMKWYKRDDAKKNYMEICKTNWSQY